MSGCALQLGMTKSTGLSNDEISKLYKIISFCLEKRCES